MNNQEQTTQRKRLRDTCHDQHDQHDQRYADIPVYLGLLARHDAFLEFADAYDKSHPMSAIDLYVQDVATHMLILANGTFSILRRPSGGYASYKKECISSEAQGVIYNLIYKVLGKHPPYHHLVNVVTVKAAHPPKTKLEVQ